MSRVAVPANSLFYGVPRRPPIPSGRAPRVVTNEMAAQYATYKKNGSSNWSDFPTATALITWGANVDGGQWFQVTNNPGTTERVWGAVNHDVLAGYTYLVSFTVDSKTGTVVNGNAAIAGVAFTGGATLNNLGAGRYALRFTATASGTATVRLGIGTDGNCANPVTIRFSKVMIERTTRIYPYEYVNPGDQAAFPYTYSATLAGAQVTAETIGTAYTPYPFSSGLVVGDSMTNDVATTSILGDFPYQMRRHSYNVGAVCTRGVPGETIAQTLTQLTNAMAEANTDSRVIDWQYVVLQGGTNDVLTGRTLVQMQADRQASIDLALSYGLRPVLMTVPPYDAGTAGQKVILTGYNAWLRSVATANNYPLYDLYTDANDTGNDGNFKASWGVSDGIHPGVLMQQGQYFMAERMADLIRFVQ